MLGIIGKLRENGLHHARTAQTRRSLAMRVQPAMEVEERPDAASSPGSPCSHGVRPILAQSVFSSVISYEKFRIWKNRIKSLNFVKNRRSLRIRDAKDERDKDTSDRSLPASPV